MREEMDKFQNAYNQKVINLGWKLIIISDQKTVVMAEIMVAIPNWAEEIETDNYKIVPDAYNRKVINHATGNVYHVPTYSSHLEFYFCFYFCAWLPMYQIGVRLSANTKNETGTSTSWAS